MQAWAVGQALALIVAICVLLLGGSIEAQSPPERLAQASGGAQPKSAGENERAGKVNNWTVGLAAGTPEGTILRFATEIARNLNDGDEMRVLPVVTPGAAENVTDLLYLRGIDVAITFTDVLEYFKSIDKIPNIESRINYISALYISELHVLVRPEITTFRDLDGKKVSFNTKGAGPTVTGPILFRRMGIKVEPLYVNNATALEMMKSGEIAGLLHTVGKPNEFLTKFKNDYGFKFLAVPFDKFQDYYVPSVFTAEDYPGYVKPGETIETIGVQAVLAVHNWPRQSDRFRRVSRFIDYYFDRFKNFHEAPYQPKWRSVSLAAKVPGWNRYPVAEAKFKQLVAKSRLATPPEAPSPPNIDLQLARKPVQHAAPNDPGKNEAKAQSK
jgi:TRAP transporter TAXI family solute receptor